MGHNNNSLTCESWTLIFIPIPVIYYSGAREEDPFPFIVCKRVETVWNSYIVSIRTSKQQSKKKKKKREIKRNLCVHYKKKLCIIIHVHSIDFRKMPENRPNPDVCIFSRNAAETNCRFFLHPHLLQNYFDLATAGSMYVNLFAYITLDESNWTSRER